MLRTKLVLMVAVLIGGLTAIVYFRVLGEYEEFARKSLGRDVENNFKYFSRAHRELADAQVKHVKETAASESLIAALTGDEAQRSDAVFEEVAVIDRKLGAEVAYVTDASGRVVARHLDPRARGTDAGNEPLVKLALDGKSRQRLFIDEQGRLVWASASPIIHPADRRIIGTLVAGQVVSDKLARAHGEFLGTEGTSFAYLLPKRLVAASLTPEQKADLDGYLKEDAGDWANAAVRSGEKSRSQTVRLAGEEFIMMLAPLKSELSSEKVGYAVLASVQQRLMDLRRLRNTVLLVGLAFLAIGIAIALLLARGVYGPLARVEQGLYEIISGRQDYEFKPTAPAIDGSLTNALNIMLATLLGRPLPDEEGEGNGGRGEWSDPLFDQAQVGDAARRAAGARGGRPKLQGLKWGGGAKKSGADDTGADTGAGAPTEARTTQPPRVVELGPPPTPVSFAAAGEAKGAALATPAAPVPPAGAAAPAATPGGPGGSPPLGSEAYYRSVYDDFVRAKQALGEDTRGVTYESFVAKLKDSEEMVKQKNGVQAVRFKVVTKDGRVSLQPLIPKPSSSSPSS